MSNSQLARSRLVPVSQAPAEDPACLLPARLTFDDLDTPCDVIDAYILGAFADGTQPFARSVRIEEVRAGAALTPAGSQVLRSASEHGRDAMLVAGEGWTLRAVRWKAGAAEVTVTAVADELAESVLSGIVAGAAVERSEDEGELAIGFWHLSPRRGAYRSTRTVKAQAWAEIRRNYAKSVAGVMGKLMAVRPADLAGQLILLYGPPGTGKTTALRALAREWLPWCRADCVLDPETLFADPSYLMEIVVGDDDDNDQAWRLLLLEDCDELIGADAKRTSGQALSRLLNLTDGLLGQGRQVLVAITTNEDLRTLHPAVIRPGRCLAQIEVGPLPAAEAAEWLGRPDGAATPMTLAELYARRNSSAPISSVAQSASPGLYL